MSSQANNRSISHWRRRLVIVQVRSMCARAPLFLFCDLSTARNRRTWVFSLSSCCETLTQNVHRQTTTTAVFAARHVAVHLTANVPGPHVSLSPSRSQFLQVPSVVRLEESVRVHGNKKNMIRDAFLFTHNMTPRRKRMSLASRALMQNVCVLREITLPLKTEWVHADRDICDASLS